MIATDIKLNEREGGLMGEITKLMNQKAELQAQLSAKDAIIASLHGKIGAQNLAIRREEMYKELRKEIETLHESMDAQARQFWNTPPKGI